MFEYYVYNKDRDTYCHITSDYLLEEGQHVLINFDNDGLDGLYECIVIEVKNKPYFES